jgi:precorrin-2 dehydrogenase/sirohydrochlorin ferrochelatase
MFPLFLDMTDRLAVVVGGGAVGRRKAAAALSAGARVRLVCLEARPSDESHPSLDWVTGPYTAAHLDGATLVFAAGPAELNARVVADARARGVWVNAANDPGASDFLVPSTVRRGRLLVAVGTGGAAPGLARSIRRQLEEQFDEAFGQWVALLAELRPVVLACVPDAGRRRTLFERWCQPEWLDRLRREGVDVVRGAMRAELHSAGDEPAPPV